MLNDYTPGPWYLEEREIDGNAYFGCIKAGANLEPLCRGHGYDDYGFVSLANARLIAAAPELLVALEHCLMFLTARDMQGMTGEEILHRAQDAIAKAKGESQ